MSDALEVALNLTIVSEAAAPSNKNLWKTHTFRLHLSDRLVLDHGLASFFGVSRAPI